MRQDAAAAGKPREPKPPEHRPPGQKYYSAKARGFFSDDLHAKEHMPDDVVAVTDDEWQAVLNEQSQGKQIVGGPDGKPIAVERVPTPAQIRRRILAQIDRLNTSPESMAAQRAAILGKPGSRAALEAIENKIAALQESLPPEPAEPAK